jgi:hypothetical protein
LLDVIMPGMAPAKAPATTVPKDYVEMADYATFMRAGRDPEFHLHDVDGASAENWKTL